MSITAEQLGYWYLRLNGFLTIVNFVVHPETGTNQRTDVDVLALRFPHRSELYLGADPMKDDLHLLVDRRRPLVFITEIKDGPCRLNGPWTDRQAQNMDRVLAAIGVIPKSRLVRAANALYSRGHYVTADRYVSLLCLGSDRSDEISTKYPKVPQITWKQVLKFIWHRFKRYRDQKISHGQWDRAGQELWRMAELSATSEDFISSAGSACAWLSRSNQRIQRTP